MALHPCTIGEDKTPSKSAILYTDANVSGILKKMNEFSCIEVFKVPQEQIDYLAAGLGGIVRPEIYAVVDILLQTLDHWDPSHLFPGTLYILSLRLSMTSF